MAFISTASSESGQAAPLRQVWTQRPKMDIQAARTLARQRSLEKKAHNYKLPLGELAVFFCSPAANNTRGVAWNMDGGWAAQ